MQYLLQHPTTNTKNLKACTSTFNIYATSYEKVKNAFIHLTSYHVNTGYR